MGGENNSQQMTGVRETMVTGRSRVDDDVSNVRPRPPNTQQSARGRVWGGVDENDKEEEYDGCWRIAGKVALAPAKRRGGCNCIVLCVWWRRNTAMDAADQRGAKTAKMA